MLVKELIEKLQEMPQDAEVRRHDWVCGGETHHDWEDEHDISTIEMSTDHAGGVVIK